MKRKRQAKPTASTDFYALEESSSEGETMEENKFQWNDNKKKKNLLLKSNGSEESSDDNDEELDGKLQSSSESNQASDSNEIEEYGNNYEVLSESSQSEESGEESTEEFYEPPVKQTGPTVAEIMEQFKRGRQESNQESNQESKESTDKSKETSHTLVPKKTQKKPLDTKTISKFQDKLEKSGVVYLSRIPPFMKPQKIRHLLGQFGAVGRVYLQPEDPKVAAKRKKAGGSKKDSFTEGWVEFEDKKMAKLVAQELNNQIIGGKKRDWYHDDIWNIKYLSGFKWHHLKEQVAYEKAVKEQKLKAEMMQQKRENKIFIKNVEKAKMIEAMEAKKAIKSQSSLNESKPDSQVSALQEAATKIRRRFKQRKVVEDSGSGGVKKGQVLADSQVKKQKAVLSKIFE